MLHSVLGRPVGIFVQDKCSGPHGPGVRLPPAEVLVCLDMTDVIVHVLRCEARTVRNERRLQDYKTQFPE